MELIQPAINPHDQFGTGFPRPGDGTGFPRPGAEPVFPQPGDEFERLRPVGTTGFPMPRIVDIVLGNLQAQPGADVVTVVPNLRNNH